MRQSLLSIIAVLVLFVLNPKPAHAAGFFGPSTDQAPSVFTYAYRGLLVGSLTGLGVGYLVARDDGFKGDDWRPFVLGAGIGGLSGAVLGFTLGFVDLASE